jgi:hypothetical protein
MAWLLYLKELNKLYRLLSLTFPDRLSFRLQLLECGLFRPESEQLSLQARQENNEYGNQ